jgi:hydroxyethylthiazole kinase-like uncharacterized protein yjeF
MSDTPDTDAGPALSFSTEARPLPLYTVAQIKAIETASMAELAPHTLMGRAGQAAAQFILERLPSGFLHPGPRVWLAAGPGNNGGDALASATELHLRGVAVEVLLGAEPTTEDALWALQRAKWAGVPIKSEWPAHHPGGDAVWYVDGLFGIGLTRPLEGVFATLARYLSAHRQQGGQVLALDVPSGLNSDTGLALDPEHQVQASHTLSFIGAKPGLYTCSGRDYAGSVWVAPLGLDAATIHQVGRRSDSAADADAAPGVIADDLQQVLNAPGLFAAQLPHRKFATHKGSFGSLAVIGGDDGMVGAPILAARAALYAGAGKVHLILMSQSGPVYDPPHPELMIHTLGSFDWSTMSALAVGPGMGQSRRAKDLLHEILQVAMPKVLDADALNLIATHRDLAALLQQHGSEVVLTPHPLECARLLGIDAAEVQQDRIRAARELAKQYACVVVLKGSGTVIATASGDVTVNPTGNAGLATGGTGDVLGGLLGALLAQGCTAYVAAQAAVYLHGLAADVMTAAGHGPAGLTASEIAPMFRTLFNRVCRATDEPDAWPGPDLAQAQADLPLA